MGFFSKIFNGLKKTKDAISHKISGLFVGELDDDFYEELEYALVSSDMGVYAVEEIMANLKKLAKKEKIKSEEDFKKLLKKVMTDMLVFEHEKQEFPQLIAFVGVNGVGKTTAIGKLAYKFSQQKKKVLMVAGDTFRAAASEQLTEWSKRSNARIVKYGEGSDSGAVVYDGIKSALAKNDDVVLIDTAGRLHNKDNLIEELKKVNRIIDREWTNLPHKNYLVIDATTGQNALAQVEVFNQAVGIDGVVLTKLDGTAKGGVVFAIAKQYNLPIVYVGVGEGVDDLIEFDAKDFVESFI